MSYIRCHSNPESLYVWGNSLGQVEWSWTVTKPLSNSKSMVVPRWKFFNVARRWNTCDEDRGIQCGGFKVRFVNVRIDTGRPVSEAAKNMKRWLKDRRQTEWLVRVEYKNTFVYLWTVTWAYLVHHVMERIKEDRRKRKR